MSSAPARIASPPAEPERASFLAPFQPAYFWTTVTALAGVSIVSLDNYVLTTAMPRVLVDLGQPVFYAWATAAFQLCQVVGLSLGGAWKDRAGLRSPFMAAVAVFALGSLASALAPSMSLLVVARGFQGLGGGGISAIAFAAGATYPESVRLRMFALVSTVWGVVALIGPLIGGSIAEFLGWRWIFVVNLPISVMVLVMCLLGFSTAVPADSRRAIPTVRAMLLALSVGALAAAPSADVAKALPLVAAGLVIGWLYVHQERLVRVPIIPLEAWTGRGPVGSCMFALLLITAAYVGSSVFVPLYLQQVRGQSAIGAGFVMTTAGVLWTAGSLIGSQVRGVWSKRAALAGSSLIAVGGALAALHASLDLPVVLMYFIWGGAAVGMGMASLHFTNWAIVFTPLDQVGNVSAGLQTIRMLGQATGGALMGAILHGIGADSAHLRTSIIAIYLVAAFLALLSATVRRPHGVDRTAAKHEESWVGPTESIDFA